MSHEDTEADKLIKALLLEEITFTEAVERLREAEEHLGLLRAKEVIRDRKQKAINDWVWEQMKKEEAEQVCEEEGHDDELQISLDCWPPIDVYKCTRCHRVERVRLKQGEKKGDKKP